MKTFNKFAEEMESSLVGTITILLGEEKKPYYRSTGSYTAHPFHPTLLKHGYEHETSHASGEVGGAEGGRVHTYFHPQTQHVVSIGAEKGKPKWETHNHKGGASVRSLQKHLSSLPR